MGIKCHFIKNTIWCIFKLMHVIDCKMSFFQIIMVRLQRVTFMALHNYLGLSFELMNPVVLPFSFTISLVIIKNHTKYCRSTCRSHKVLACHGTPI